MLQAEDDGGDDAGKPAPGGDGDGDSDSDSDSD
jgi:hypothetical protein